MLQEIQRGAGVDCTDGPLGFVERVLVDEQTSRPSAILVRHGPADHLLWIPERLIAESSSGHVHLSIRFDEAEMAGFAWEEGQGGQKRVSDGGATNPTPSEDDLLPRIAGSPKGGPATG